MTSASDIKNRATRPVRESRDDIPDFTLDLLDSRNIRYHFDNGRLCVDQDLSEVYQGLKDLAPLKGIWKINGSLFLNRNHLKNLIGCPEIIEGDLVVSANKLVSMAGCPKFIGGNLDVSWNYNLTSLNGIGQVEGDIVVHHTPLDPNFDPLNPLGNYAEIASKKSRMRALAESILSEKPELQVGGDVRTIENSFGVWLAHSQESLEKFWRWFGDSKIVDNQGRPMVMYHGTAGRFKSFDKSRIGSNQGNARGDGFYFTTDRKAAEHYGSRVVPVYLKIEHPLTATTIKEKTNELLALYLDGNNDSSVREIVAPYIASKTKSVMASTDFIKGLAQKHNTTFAAIMNKLGFDGVIETDQVVVLEPTQIKSVDNFGDWNPASPDIYESKI